MGSIKSKLPYPSVGTELEYSSRKAYTTLIENLTQEKIKEEPIKYLNKTIDTYSEVQNSSPPEGKESQWALEIIKTYKNLGFVLEEIKRYLPKNLKSMQNKISRLEGELITYYSEMGRKTHFDEKKDFGNFKEGLREL